jgi:hypothetical protein
MAVVGVVSEHIEKLTDGFSVEQNVISNWRATPALGLKLEEKP